MRHPVFHIVIAVVLLAPLSYTAKLNAAGELGTASDKAAFAMDVLATAIECRASLVSGGDVPKALVVVNDGQKHRYAIVGAEGPERFGTLEFRPQHMRAAITADGQILSAFADLRRNAIVDRGVDELEPIKIFLDDQEIYSSNKVWDASLAEDGSSYFVVEPLADNTARILVYEVKSGISRFYSVETKLTPLSLESDFFILYSPQGDEIVIGPSIHGSVDLSYTFIRVDGRPSVTRSLKSVGYGGVFESSRIAYVLRAQDDPSRPSQVAKVQFPEEPGGSPTTLWAVTLPGNHMIYSAPKIEGDGKWITVNAFKPYILHAENGKVAFDFPDPREPEKVRARLSGTKGKKFVQLGGRQSLTVQEDHVLMKRRVMYRDLLAECLAGPAPDNLICDEKLRASGDTYDLVFEFPIVDGVISRNAKTARRLPYHKCRQYTRLERVGDLEKSNSGLLAFRKSKS